MKLLLFVIILTFKCSWLSSAPADAPTEPNSNEIDESWTPVEAATSPSYITGHLPENMAYVADMNSDNLEARRRSMLDRSFIRFGRSENKNRILRRASPNMMRFGRSSWDEPEYVPDATKAKKSDKNLLRFGRAGFMRFGRNYMDENDDDYNDASEVEDFIDIPHRRNPQSQGQLRMNGTPDKEAGNKKDLYSGNILRLGRSSSESDSDESFDSSEQSLVMPNPEMFTENGAKKSSNDKNMLRFGRAGNIMRFGRGNSNMMRFGRANMMRFGRSEGDKNLMRFGRANMMRFGRSDKNLLRFGRAGNLIRFGRNDKNLMRFGKRDGTKTDKNSLKSSIYCENDNCLMQKDNEYALTLNKSPKNDHLQELFGNDDSRQGYAEYIIEKK